MADTWWSATRISGYHWLQNPFKYVHIDNEGTVVQKFWDSEKNLSLLKEASSTELLPTYLFSFFR